VKWDLDGLIQRVRNRDGISPGIVLGKDPHSKKHENKTGKSY
jgi:hypothetical protein